MNDCYEELIEFPLSNRVMQAYGAACIVRFCAERGIHSPCVDQLVSYLLQLMSSNSLDEWEQAGSLLELSGRENALPDDPANRLAADERIPFKRLLESVVEIGISDMYGGDTDAPVRALVGTRHILATCGIMSPAISELRALTQNQRGWGRPRPDREARLIEAWCLHHWERSASFDADRLKKSPMGAVSLPAAISGMSRAARRKC